MSSPISHAFLHERLCVYLEQAQLFLTPEQINQIIEYVFLLIKWNEIYNLTAVREPEQILIRHVMDCLAVLPYLQGKRLLDVGTGGGLPGILLAIAQPEMQCTLLDSNQKKMRFIRQVCIELELKTVTPACQRIEAWSSEEYYDTVISRAYANVFRFYEQAYYFVEKNGCLLAMKGQIQKNELDSLNIGKINFSIFPLKIPGLNEQRHLIQIVK